MRQAVDRAYEYKSARQALRDDKGCAECAQALGQHVAVEAIEDGVSETEIARNLGVSRMTVRKWTGKR